MPPIAECFIATCKQWTTQHLPHSQAGGKRRKYAHRPFVMRRTAHRPQGRLCLSRTLCCRTATGARHLRVPRFDSSSRLPAFFVCIIFGQLAGNSCHRRYVSCSARSVPNSLEVSILSLLYGHLLKTGAADVTRKHTTESTTGYHSH